MGSRKVVNLLVIHIGFAVDVAVREKCSPQLSASVVGAGSPHELELCNL